MIKHNEVLKLISKNNTIFFINTYYFTYYTIRIINICNL